MANNVAGLSNYVNEHNDELLTAMVAKAKTIGTGKIRLIEGVKYKERFHFFAPSLVWQTGNCVGDDSSSGGTTFTEKDIETTQLTHFELSCMDDFNNKWYGALLPDGSYYDSDDYIQAVADKLTLVTQKDVENAIWRGDASQSSLGGMMDEVDGLIKNLDDYGFGTFVSGSSYNTTFAAANAIAIIDDLVASAPEAISEEELTVFISRSDYNILKVALRNAYNDTIQDDRINDVASFAMPGYSNVTIQVAPGLSSAGRIVLTYTGNLVVATDLLSDDQVRIGYDETKDKVYNRIKFKLGTEIAFPEHVVMHKN